MLYSVPTKAVTTGQAASLSDQSAHGSPRHAPPLRLNTAGRIP
ncbi:hypothetical protein [Paludisphaera soli]|nr:hypothetical protein [Paludisphaera soli]